MSQGSPPHPGFPGAMLTSLSTPHSALIAGSRLTSPRRVGYVYLLMSFQTDLPQTHGVCLLADVESGVLFCFSPI